MSSSILKESALLIIFLILATAVIAVTDADIRTSSIFCVDGKWPIGEQFPWKALYRIDRIPAVLLASVGLAALLISFIRRDRRSWARPGAFLVLLLALGPGLVVNSLFKDQWGRPRPREIVQFEGKKEFLQPWQKGVSGNGRSFPSGHTSAAAYLAAPFFIYRHRNRRIALAWLTGGVVFGILMSIARIAQGGHFLSDTVWAFGMVYLIAILLAAILKLDTNPADSAATKA